MFVIVLLLILFWYAGKTNLTDFITQVGQNAAQQAINILLQFIGLRDKIDDGPCASTTQDGMNKIIK